MNETQFGGLDAQQPVSRKPHGPCQLNRLSPDRQAAVADYAASHTLPETVEWLNRDSQRSKPKLGLDLIAEAFRDNPEALKIYEQACEMIDPARPRSPPNQHPARKIGLHEENPGKSRKILEKNKKRSASPRASIMPATLRAQSQGRRRKRELNQPCPSVCGARNLMDSGDRRGHYPGGWQQTEAIIMRTLLLGVDSGTQSTKVLVVDARDAKVLASAAQEYDLIPELGPGAKEQHPHTWREATASAIRRALRQAKAVASEVKAIGVSGQQHGFVPLDSAGEVIRPAKLWCDTATAPECEEIMQKLGGLKATVKALGNAVLPGFTASKILWLKKHEPENYARLACVLLPHDYLNFWLTGERTMEYGDASGTGLLDVRQRVWSKAALAAIDPELAGKLPLLTGSDRPAGALQASAARMLDLNPGVLVSAGGGDNMMGAIGTGNTRPGVITASLGTSGTIYACAEKPVVDPKGEIAAFCDSTNRWLPLLCTMNVTVATEMVREDFGWSHEKYAAEAARVAPGSDGLLLLPYFEGERTPNVPEGTGVWFGVNRRTFEAGHFARAAMEGVTLGMNYGLRRLAQLGVEPTQIRATGGGAKSKLWRQVMADIFNAEVVTLKVGEGAAFGAALQALWCWRLQQGEKITISELTDQFVEVNSVETTLPNAKNAEIYGELQEVQNQMSTALLRVFKRHRQFVLRR